MTEAKIHYAVHPVQVSAHLFEVRLRIDDADATGVRLALPAWIPGSYMIREFARHVVAIGASVRARPVRILKLDKHTWQVQPAPAQGGSVPLLVTARIFAHDHSVRGAWLDTQRGFFNGTSLFLRVIGREHEPVTMLLRAPTGPAYRRWRAITSMQPVKRDARGFGLYCAPDYDELIDHPVELGTFTEARFVAAGLPHRIAVAGHHQADMPRLARDLKVVCEHHLRFFGAPAPTDRYVFMVNALGEGYGGLEHRASTALVCARDELPQRGSSAVSEGYRTFLGLASHEYFHTWIVKRIKPAAFTPYDLDRENYTALLWVFEGITSYYDDLALVRSGLISREQYLGTLSQSLTNLARTPGRLVQSVADSSFDAWIKYYRQDENTPNAVVSYYLKGSLIALCLDLLIRTRTRGARSLDDVMRALWRRHGRSDAGVDEDGFERLAEEVSGLSLRSFFGQTVRSVRELPVAQLIAPFGLSLRWRAARSATDRGGAIAASARKPLDDANGAPLVSLGMRTGPDGGDVRVTHVLTGSAAQEAGIAAGDAIIAIDGLRVTGKSFDRVLARLRPGVSVGVHLFRRDELLECALTPKRALADTCDVVMPARPMRALDAWLGRRR